jgi:predicted TPR repeat methyltransferase
MQDFQKAKEFFFHGLSLLESENFAEAEASFLKSLEIIPDRVSTLTNLSAAQIKLKKYAEARKSSMKAVALDGMNCEAWLNLGTIEKKVGNPTQAIEYFDKAAFLRPDYAEAWHNKGAVLYELKRYEEALGCYDRAIALKPEYAEAYYSRATAYRELGQKARATEDLGLARTYNYKNEEEIDFVLAAMEGTSGPAAPPRAFVADLFDDYAAKFESHLLEGLKYRAHETLYRRLREVIGEDLVVLDIGCGTGLVGALLRPHAKTLVGIDISGEMLEQARAKRIYDRLHRDDLNDFLLQAQAGSYDLIVATDVFNYLGDLSEVFGRIRKVLRRGGYYGFTVEKLEAGDFRLRTTLRYSHSSEYCSRLAASSNLTIVSEDTSVIRQEKGVDVLGSYFVMRKV